MENSHRRWHLQNWGLANTRETLGWLDVFSSYSNFLMSSNLRIMEVKSEGGLPVSFHENRCCKVEMY